MSDTEKQLEALGNLSMLAFTEAYKSSLMTETLLGLMAADETLSINVFMTAFRLNLMGAPDLIHEQLREEANNLEDMLRGIQQRVKESE